MKPRQPAISKVLIPVDEKNEISGSVGDFFDERKQKNEKNAFYI